MVWNVGHYLPSTKSWGNKGGLLSLVGTALLAIWIFFYVAFEVTEKGIGDRAWIGVDQGIMKIVADFRSESHTAEMLTFTYLGSTFSVVVIAIIALLLSHFKRLKSERRILACAGLASIFLIRSSKLFFGRERPNPENWLTSAAGLSFPSGHSAGSFAVLGALFFIIGRSCKKQYRRFLVWSLGAIVVFMVGFSRVYLGVHFPTDVLGGFLLGLSILLLSIAFDDFCERKNSPEAAT